MFSKTTDNFSVGVLPVNSGRLLFVNFNQCGAVILMSLSAAIFLCGCHKKTEVKSPPPEIVSTPAAPAAPTAASAPAATISHAPVPQALPASSQAIVANANAEEVAGQLSTELRRYVSYTRTIPKNFEDFIAHDPIKFPPPPAGKKYVITGGRVALQ